MARIAVADMKEKIDGIFPLKTFCLSLAVLLLSFFIAVGVYQAFIAPPVHPIELTGKTMAMLEVDTKIVDEPIKTVVPDEPTPAPDAHLTEEHSAPEHGTDDNAPSADPTTHEATAAVPLPEPPSISIPDAIPDLLEGSIYGPLPDVRDSDGLTPFEAYKAPFTLKPETKGVIAVVMVDYGLSDKLSDTAVQTLPPLTNFVASPYADDLQSKISKAHAKSIEIWMTLPMQGNDNSRAYNMGQNAILAGLSAKENTARLKTSLGRATGYAGVALTVKPAFPSNSQDLQSIINAVSLRGLGIAQLEPNDTVIDTAASQSSAQFVNGHFWIDDVLTHDAIFKKLADAEKLSLQKGSAVISFHPAQLTIDAIAKWQQSLALKNIQLAPLTYAVKIDGPTPQSAATPPTKEAVKESPKETPKETPHVQH